MAQKPKEWELERLNLQALQEEQGDESIRKILCKASHTSLYEFDKDSCEWNRVGVEGTLFLVQADKEPCTRLVVLNKLGMDNFSLDILQIRQAKLQPPYVMLRLNANKPYKILGLWFHEDSEQTAVKAAIDSAIKQASTSSSLSNSNSSSTKSLKPKTPTQKLSQDELSMEALSEGTVAFHDQTHKNGAPIEIDSSLPNKFNEKKNDETPSSSPSEGVNKGLAILNCLKSASSKSDDILTDRDVTSRASRIENADESRYVLFAPSDITGVRRQFSKR